MDFLVLSHLRWNFVFQRPQHLFTRCARQHPVYFWEEPEFRDGIQPRLRHRVSQENVHVLVPELPSGISEQESFVLQQELLTTTLSEHGVGDFVAWYYTPMARNFSRHLHPKVVVYDCMDELSAFRGAPPGLRHTEAELFKAADLVFTGGSSLYHSKRKAHHSVHLFPSSIDTTHFRQARNQPACPPDLAAIASPRIGYCGVIDERLDLQLLAAVADLRPEWNLVMLGPVVKISLADLPMRPNIHYLGGKNYDELPAYMAHWELAMMPFALNESTRFISPTKTPEYLAAGCPVVSTPITDVVRPYGELELVQIAGTAQEFVDRAAELLNRDLNSCESARLRKVDQFLTGSSWDKTWAEMYRLILQTALGLAAGLDSSTPPELATAAEIPANGD
jgi:UDP-galactopyranose mutase